MRASESRPSATNAETANEQGSALALKYTRVAYLESLAKSPGYGVRCVQTLANGRTKGQVFASLQAAVRTAERAEVRGCQAVLSLVRIVPVSIVAPEQIDVLRRDSL